MPDENEFVTNTGMFFLLLLSKFTRVQVCDLTLTEPSSRLHVHVKLCFLDVTANYYST